MTVAHVFMICGMLDYVLNSVIISFITFFDNRQKKLQYRPPLEEIRAKYFREMKKFIGIPGHFKGVSDSTENLIYPAIIDRNAAGFIVCYKKANDLFVKLEKAQEQFKVSL